MNLEETNKIYRKTFGKQIRQMTDAELAYEYGLKRIFFIGYTKILEEELKRRGLSILSGKVEDRIC